MINNVKATLSVGDMHVPWKALWKGNRLNIPPALSGASYCSNIESGSYLNVLDDVETGPADSSAECPGPGYETYKIQNWHIG